VAAAEKNIGWSDVGFLVRALGNSRQRDPQGNSYRAAMSYLDGTAGQLRASEERLVAAIGVRNTRLIVVDDEMPSSLPTRRIRSRSKKLVDHLIIFDDAGALGLARFQPTVASAHRPWGYYESNDSGRVTRVQARSMLKPGARISFAAFNTAPVRRHWVVVPGRSEVRPRFATTIYQGPNQSTELSPRAP
jgi:hypothetical protein